MLVKKCVRCGISKDLSEFYKHRVRPDGVQVWCKQCALTRRREYYQENKEREQETHRKYVEKKKALVLKYLKGHPCVDCGEDDPVVLHFDHVRGDKVDYIANMVWFNGVGSLEAEIEKCEIRCANCHIRRHDRERKLGA